MNIWVVLGYGALGAILGTLTGRLLSTNHKILGSILFATGSVIGWSLVGGSILGLVKAILAHQFVWHHFYRHLPANAAAFKSADGLCTLFSFSGTLIIRRVRSGKGFPMTRLIAAMLLLMISALHLFGGVAGVVPATPAVLIVVICPVLGWKILEQRQRRVIICLLIRWDRAVARVTREHPELVYRNMFPPNV